MQALCFASVAPAPTVIFYPILYQAFVAILVQLDTYFGMGADRSITAVGQKLGKSRVLMERWSRLRAHRRIRLHKSYTIIGCWSRLRACRRVGVAIATD